MAQLLAHLVGDYILQTDRMANLKTKDKKWAIIHGFVYTLPFLFITHNALILFVIAVTHAVIDHYRLAKYVIYLKNSLTDWSTHDQFLTPTGYSEATPAWMAVWLFIIADNTMHLLINYGALKWL